MARPDRLNELGQAEIARELLRLREENEDLRNEVVQLTQAIAEMYASAKYFLESSNELAISAPHN